MVEFSKNWPRRRPGRRKELELTTEEIRSSGIIVDEEEATKGKKFTCIRSPRGKLAAFVL
jgi:hypothetical protein